MLSCNVTFPEMMYDVSFAMFDSKLSWCGSSSLKVNVCSELSGQLVERVATEFNKLQFYVNKCRGLPLVDEIRPVSYLSTFEHYICCLTRNACVRAITRCMWDAVSRAEYHITDANETSPKLF